jgi:hypothetical protein
MVDALFVTAETSPVRLVLKNAVEQSIDREGLSGTRIAG